MSLFLNKTWSHVLEVLQFEQDEQEAYERLKNRRQLRNRPRGLR
jgi:hypothetical protein